MHPMVRRGAGGVGDWDRLGGRGDGRSECGRGRRDRRHDAHDAIARHLAHGRLRKVTPHVPEFQGGFGMDDMTLTRATEAQGRKRGPVVGRVAGRDQDRPARGQAHGV